MLNWIDVMDSYPYRTPEQKQKALKIMAMELDGYVAAADAPPSQLVPELLELYPDAKVICTVRDPERWAASIVQAGSWLGPITLSYIMYWVPVLTHAGKFIKLVQKMYRERYGRAILAIEDGPIVWKRHLAWLEEVVPKGQLYFVDMKDGWEPLCEALDVPVPKDVPFPRINEMQALENHFKQMLLKGLYRWGMVLAGASVFVGGAVTILSRSKAYSQL